MNLHKIFSKAALVLAGRRSVAELEQKNILTTHMFIDPQSGQYTSAIAHKNEDNTWTVSTLSGDEKGQSTVDSSGHGTGGDIARSVSLETAYDALWVYEKARFAAGAKLATGFVQSINPDHYATFKSAIVKKRRQEGPK